MIPLIDHFAVFCQESCLPILSDQLPLRLPIQYGTRKWLGDNIIYNLFSTTTFPEPYYHSEKSYYQSKDTFLIPEIHSLIFK